MGAFLGAIITGLIAMSVFYLQHRNNAKKESEHYKKVFAELKKNLNLTGKSAEIFKDLVLNNDFENDDLKVCHANFFLVSALLEKVEVKDIPYEIYSVFYDLKDSLATIKLCSELYIEVKSLTFLRDDLLSDVNRFNKNLEKLENYYNK